MSAATSPTISSQNAQLAWLGHAAEKADRLLEAISDYINPILVKEARQAVKSRQFVWPFAVTLLAALVWSYWSAAQIMQGGRLAEEPGLVSFGFFMIMLFPAIILVPYSAFQSIGAERQESTLDLVWITTLSGRQIVIGKFLGAVLQLIAYSSAIAPCIIFTYFLQGVDIITMILVVFYSILGSMLLSSFTIMVSTGIRNTYLSMATSAALLVMLIIVYCATASFLGAAMFEPFFIGEVPWVAHLAVATIAASFLVLFLLAAGAQMSFAGENHSTLIRSYALAQQTLFFFWLCLTPQDDGGGRFFWWIVFIFFGLYWAILGSFMIGELAILSPRARRTLPRTALGRILLTWLQPGSGTGYVFVLASLGGTFLYSIGIFGWSSPQESLVAGTLGLAIWTVVAAYLGLARIIMLFINRYGVAGPVVAFCVTAILATFSTIMPTLSTALADVDVEVSLAMRVNWAYVLSRIINWAFTASTPNPVAWELVIIGPLAAAMLLVNLALTVQEIAAGRLPPPASMVLQKQSTHKQSTASITAASQ